MMTNCEKSLVIHFFTEVSHDYLVFIDEEDELGVSLTTLVGADIVF